MDDSFSWDKHLGNKRKIQFRLSQLDKCMFQSPMSFTSNINRNRGPQEEIVAM